jgi:pilus assembly protein FimV
MNRQMKLSLAIALALGSPAAFALGLGGIQVQSGLNEPLVADIPIIESAPGEAEGIKANLAKAEDFARVGLDVRSVAVPLEFTLTRDAAGKPIIHVESLEPVREPFLSFLVEVTWGKGRLLREYSLLLDPPVVAPAVIGSKTVLEPVQEPEVAQAEPIDAPPPAELPVEPTPLETVPPEPVAEVEPPPAEPAPIETPAEEPPPPVEPYVETPTEPAAEPAPEPAAEPVQEPYTPPEEPVAEAPAPSAAPGEYGPVAEGETLWEIASSTRSGDVSVNQMMIAILRSNPDAFSNGNINELRRGAVLRVPSGDEVQAIALAEASAEVATQMEAWRGSRGATLVTDNAYATTTGTPSSAASTPDSRLALLPPRAGAEGSGADRSGVAGGTDTSSVLRADLARTQEQLASREQESGELRSRVTELERLQTDNRRLIEFKESEIAELQRKLAEAQRNADEASRRLAEVPPASTTSTPEPVAATPEPLPSEPVAAEPAPVETPPVEPAVDPLATAEPTTVDPLSTDPATTDTTASTDSLSTGATPSADGTDVAVTDAGTAEITPVAETPAVTPEPVIDGERPAMPLWRNPLVMGGIAASLILVLTGVVMLMRRRRRVVEPALERSSVADEFHGGVFGGGAVAATGEESEHELLERLAADPTDLDTHLQLLRLYYNEGDAEQFEAAASAMYAQVTDVDAPQWQEAMEMGRLLIPSSPMFEAPAPVSDGTDEFDFAALEPHSSGGYTPPPPTPARDDFDFSLEAPTVAKPVTPEVKVSTPAADTFRTQEFKRPEPIVAPKVVAPVVVAPVVTPTAADDGSFFDGDDAVGTKLDLARAYMDMGDPDGARSMLQEVIAEGTDAQKSEARRLLGEIG